MSCDWKIEDFRAYPFITGEPPGPFVVVEGAGRCPTTGYTVHLEKVGDEDGTLQLRLLEDRPGGLVQETVTETTVEEFRTPSQARRVAIEDLGSIEVVWPGDA